MVEVIHVVPIHGLSVSDKLDSPHPQTRAMVVASQWGPVYLCSPWTASAVQALSPVWNQPSETLDTPCVKARLTSVCLFYLDRISSSRFCASVESTLWNTWHAWRPVCSPCTALAVWGISLVLGLRTVEILCEKAWMTSVILFSRNSISRPSILTCMASILQSLETLWVRIWICSPWTGPAWSPFFGHLRHCVWWPVWTVWICCPWTVWAGQALSWSLPLESHTWRPDWPVFLCGPRTNVKSTLWMKAWQDIRKPDWSLSLQSMDSISWPCTWINQCGIHSQHLTHLHVKARLASSTCAPDLTVSVACSNSPVWNLHHALLTHCRFACDNHCICSHQATLAHPVYCVIDKCRMEFTAWTLMCNCCEDQWICENWTPPQLCNT